MRTFVGSVPLPNPILTASGTSGHGAELGAYVDLAALGAVVVKSLAAGPWAGNPAPRVHETPAGMLNSVGLQGTGVEAWLEDELPALNQRGARVVASIWGRRVEDYAQAAAMLADAPGVVAVEVNVSCPNLDDRSRMFAHSARATAEAVSASAACGLPRWAKLSPNVPDIVEIAGAALDAGAEALVLVNTVLGMAIDPKRRAYRLGSGAGGGGLSGPAIRPVAVRAVHDCRAAFPDASIVGVGGVSRGVDAVEMLLAGADAVEVGTATFRDPRAPARVLAGLARWCRFHDVGDVRSLVAAVHGAPAPTRSPSAPSPSAPSPSAPSVPAFYPATTAPPAPSPVRPPSRPVTRPPGPSRLPPPPPRRPGPTAGGDRGR
jgi:dihydroorotate dehydrogenase (NAD+) catalytic subunit